MSRGGGGLNARGPAQKFLKNTRKVPESCLIGMAQIPSGGTNIIYFKQHKTYSVLFFPLNTQEVP